MFFDTAGTPHSRNLDDLPCCLWGKRSAPLFPYSPSSQILIGELVKRMSIISDSQEDVRNLCQPRDGGRDGAWRPGKVPLQRAGLRKLHREEVPCNLLSRASAASSLYECQSHTVESSIAVTYVTFTLKLINGSVSVSSWFYQHKTTGILILFVDGQHQ